MRPTAASRREIPCSSGMHSTGNMTVRRDKDQEICNGTGLQSWVFLQGTYNSCYFLHRTANLLFSGPLSYSSNSCLAEETIHVRRCQKQSLQISCSFYFV